jgi:hypothetical protein
MHISYRSVRHSQPTMFDGFSNRQDEAEQRQDDAIDDAGNTSSGVPATFDLLITLLESCTWLQRVY